MVQDERRLGANNQKMPLQAITSALSPIWTMAILQRTTEVGAQRSLIRKVPDRGFGPTPTSIAGRLKATISANQKRIRHHIKL